MQHKLGEGKIVSHLNGVFRQPLKDQVIHGVTNCERDHGTTAANALKESNEKATGQWHSLLLYSVYQPRCSIPIVTLYLSSPPLQSSIRFGLSFTPAHLFLLDPFLSSVVPSYLRGEHTR
ncbi:hypothetical protein EYF80_018490 [Liparis tanakae]|uniref:Uncharacterized protein n=1 Tax=Liparis tanakae TaxID=230148 RepID=A0A4Z2I070_9TELE|nr:hypothetical protein EYF80_018490 [Liparis tanakae]